MTTRSRRSTRSSPARADARPRRTRGEGSDVMDIYEALYTTRAMRRVKPDPIPADVQAKILDAAVRAPSGGNMQNWRFMLVDDADVKAQLGPIYRDCLGRLWDTIYKEPLANARANPDDPESAQLLRIQRSAQHLADHFEGYPLLLFSFVQFDPSGGSLFPATWAAMLPAPAGGIGAAPPTGLIFRIDERLKILRVPPGEGRVLSAWVLLG